MRQEHHCLAQLGQLFGIQLADHDGQRDRNQHAQNNEYAVVHQRIAHHVAKVAGFEEELEVVQPHPAAVVDQAPQKALARPGLIVLKGDDDAEHGGVAEYGKPNGCGQMQQEEFQIVKCGTRRRASAFLFSYLLMFRLRRRLLVQRPHPFRRSCTIRALFTIIAR